jgi:hypothetical protein
MTKILKKVQLSTEQSTPKSADPTKGTVTNPFTQVEMATLQEEGTWNGGYVEGQGYITSTPETVIYYPFYIWAGMSVAAFVALCIYLLDKENMYEFICEHFPFSPISKDYFERYWYAKGDKVLNDPEFSNIINTIGDSTPSSTGSVEIKNKTYVYKIYNFESDYTYRFALGSTFYIFYDNNIPVGCFDRYDFNSCEWGKRKFINELLTRAMNQLGSFYEAQNYKIYYGVYKEFS